MASSGNLISYANFSNTYSGGLVLDKDTGSSHNSCSVYVSSPSWWAQIIINKNVGTWERSFTLFASYWNGSTWVEAWRDTQRMGQLEGGKWTFKYYHNSTLGSTPGDVASAVLWELHLDHPELYRKRMWVYAGGIGCMPEDTYNNLYRGRPIYSCGRLGEDSRHNAGDQGRKRDEALSIFSQSANSGTPITASNEAKLVAYKYN